MGPNALELIYDAEDVLIEDKQTDSQTDRKTERQTKDVYPWCTSVRLCGGARTSKTTTRATKTNNINRNSYILGLGVMCFVAAVMC